MSRSRNDILVEINNVSKLRTKAQIAYLPEIDHLYSWMNIKRDLEIHVRVSPLDMNNIKENIKISSFNSHVYESNINGNLTMNNNDSDIFLESVRATGLTIYYAISM
ncbi:MAG: hypothetical protein PWP31_1547 [Clostridia bacterium]|nr:hypothetical protein [Clostridia bacterium]